MSHLAIGDNVRIAADPVAPILRGLEGKIVDTMAFEGKQVYAVRADNCGPPMPTPRGTKPTRAWVPGDIRKLEAKYLQPQ